MKNVPFNDLKVHHERHRKAFHQALDQMLDSSAFIGGAAVADFERAFASYCDVAHAVAVGNGTDALVIALKALGVGQGDLVVTVPNTFIATTEAITSAGAGILFVDVCDGDLNMDMDALAALLGSHPERARIKAVIPVHLHGQPADMIKLKDILKGRSVAVVADAAQAHGAEVDGRSICHYADITTFSFYPGKNLGALGDAGALVTSDAALAKKAKAWSNHGRKDKYEHQFEGVNSRCDALQALFLQKKLAVLPEATAARQSLAQAYIDRLLDLAGVSCPTVISSRRSVFHLFAIRVSQRDELQQALAERGIQTGVHYPIPLHLQPAYAHLGLSEGDFPVAERLSRESLSLPLYPEMPLEFLDHVVQSLRELLSA